MKKTPTVFVRDENDRRHVTRELTPGCEWVLAGEGIATRKYDGTCVMLDEDGAWWARREVKRGKNIPPGYVTIEHDQVTGKLFGWEPIAQSSFAKIHAEALDCPARYHMGTYELIGPKVNGNPEKVRVHLLRRHGDADIFDDAPRAFNALGRWLRAHPYEGIVFHHPDGRMAKIKVRDFPEAGSS